MGTNPSSSTRRIARNTALEAWDTRQELAPLREFLKWQTEKHGRRRSCVRGASVRVFYLFYLRLVQLPHHLVRWAPSSRWWAE